MNFLKKLLKPKDQRLFDQAMQKHDYLRALAIGERGSIPADRIAEANRRQTVYNAIADAIPTEYLTRCFQQTADALQSPAAVDALKEPDRTSVYLALIGVALKDAAYEAALNLLDKIKSDEGTAQGMRKIAGHMACAGHDNQHIVEVLGSLPQPAFIAEELRNFLLSRILCRNFDSARHILLKIPHSIRRGLEPQLVFIERNHVDMRHAAQRARELVHPDDIALTMALIAGVNDDIDRMAQYAWDVSPQIRLGTQATYAASLAYAGKVGAAITLLENLRDHEPEYLFRLGYLAFAFPLSHDQMQSISKIFSQNEPYESSLAFWYHRFLEDLVENRCDRIEAWIPGLENPQLRLTLAGLLAEFISVV